MPKPNITALRYARDLVAKEKGWCKFYLGMDADGRACTANDPGAIAFCASGALQRALPTKTGGVFSEDFYGCVAALNAALPSPGTFPDAITNVVRYNNADGRTQADIVDLFDRAIEANTHA